MMIILALLSETRIKRICILKIDGRYKYARENEF